MTPEITETLTQHAAWLDNPNKGKQANLQRANLRGANLWGANLREADLQQADLRGANLREANLREANLWRANLWGADLREANLWGANLRGVNLRKANLLSCHGVTAVTVGDHQAIHQPWTDPPTIQIGCTTLTPEQWLEQADSLTNEHDLRPFERATLEAFVRSLA
jgi:uncharacterized protein YjbI with pentapeptide repeats